MENGKNNGLDPEILELLGEVDVPGVEEEETPEAENEKITEEKEESVTIDSEHLKNILTGVKKEIVDVLTRTKLLYEDPPDKKDKFMYREKLSVAYWQLIGDLAPRTIGNMDLVKLLCFRYGLLDPEWLTESQLKLIKSVPQNEDINESLYYMDEWFNQVGVGKIKASVLDETVFLKKKGEKTNEKLDKKQGQLESELQLCRTREKNVEDIITMLENGYELVKSRVEWGIFPELELKEPLSDVQKDALSTMTEAIKDWIKIDKKLETSLDNIADLKQEIEELKELAENESEAGVEVDNEKIYNEFICIKQMYKMCVGRRGNHFPILDKDYFMGDSINLGTKKNVLRILKEVEYLDKGLFRRTHKGVENRIFPIVILLPSYGEEGVCWEPFDRHNRATSKSRLAIPMYTKNLKETVLTALGDLRWQIAKERAQHYWMEEGITGHYYEYYTEQGLKGDIKSFFINDYILWITKESQGVQKLDKRVRSAFWRYMPFPQKVKDILKTRGFAYLDLYKKDENIARSDGY